MTNDKLSDIFYQPENLWTGRKAIKLLKQESKESTKAVKSWLALQALWQIHLPRPKKIEYAHFYVTKPNKIHQADLLYLPHDKVYQNTYKYTLNVIDVASGYARQVDLYERKRPARLLKCLKTFIKRGL